MLFDRVIERHSSKLWIWTHFAKGVYVTVVMTDG